MLIKLFFEINFICEGAHFGQKGQGQLYYSLLTENF